MACTVAEGEGPGGELNAANHGRYRPIADCDEPRNQSELAPWQRIGEVVHGLVHGQVTIIFLVSVCLSVCLFVCLFVCAEFFSAVFDPISIKLGQMLYVWV